MKRLKGILLTLLLLLPMISVFGLATQADAQGDTVDLVLHKRIIRDINKDEVTYENNGLELDEDFDIVTGPTPLNGAEFTVYDISDYFYAEKADQSLEELMKEYGNRTAAKELIKSGKIQEIATVSTGAEDNPRGTARVPVSRKKDGRYALYLIFENEVVNDTVEFNIDLERIANPIIVALPIMNPTNQTEELDEIHIYPKNIGYLRDPYFFKYGKENAESPEIGVPLEGAIFVLYQMVGNQKLYLDLSPVSDLQNSWIPSDDPLNNPDVSKFTSDKDGVVTTGGRLLPSGEFFFEEVQSVEGYQIEKTDIPVVVPDSWEDENGNPLYVTVNGQQMDELESGEVPASAYQKAEPRVYNYETPTPPTDPEDPATPQQPGEPTPPKKPFLPVTGEAKSFISLIGVLLLGIGLVIWHRRKAAIKSNSEDK